MLAAPPEQIAAVRFGDKRAFDLHLGTTTILRAVNRLRAQTAQELDLYPALLWSSTTRNRRLL